MKKTFLKSTILLAFVSTSIFATAQKVNLKFAPADGSKYIMEVKTDNNMTQEVMGQEMKISMIMDSKNFYTIKNNGASKELTNTFDKITAKTSAMGQEMNLSTESDNAESKSFKNIKGKSYTATVSENGEVTSLTGTDAIAATIKGDEAANSYFSEKALKEIIEQGFNFYPGKEISVGDTWNKNSTMNKTVKMTTKTVYKLIGVQGDIADISFDGIVSTDGNVPYEAQGMTMDMKLDGTTKGTMKVNIKDGMPVESVSNISLKGAVTAMGMEIPITSLTSTTQKSTKQ